MLSSFITYPYLYAKTPLKIQLLVRLYTYRNVAKNRPLTNSNQKKITSPLLLYTYIKQLTPNTTCTFQKGAAAVATPAWHASQCTSTETRRLPHAREARFIATTPMFGKTG